MSGSGSCLCGSVNLEYNSEPNFFLLCHCTDCQKATGSPVASIIGVPEDNFIIKGETNSYKCEACVTRSFFINCGSQIFSTAEGAPGLMLIKTGVLDEQPYSEPTMVCWTDSKPDWLEIKHPSLKFEKNPG